MDFVEGIIDFLRDQDRPAAVDAAAVLIAGLVVSRLVRRRLRLRLLGTHHGEVVNRLSSWAILVVSMAWALHELGFDLRVLLGAAGVLTVAVGFASQTSASNLISGLFLMFERPFTVGDLIKVDDTTGEVLSIDLLSVRLRTFDNLMVRIPNETMFKTKVTTLTYFPLRRVDLEIGVAYKEDLTVVREILDQVSKENPLCLEEPAPQFIFRGYGDSALLFTYACWGAKQNFLELKNRMYLRIKTAFDERGIEIPFPHMSLYAGSETEPLPVRMTGEQL